MFDNHRAAVLFKATVRIHRQPQRAQHIDRCHAEVLFRRAQGKLRRLLLLRRVQVGSLVPHFRVHTIQQLLDFTCHLIGCLAQLLPQVFNVPGHGNHRLCSPECHARWQSGEVETAIPDLQADLIRKLREFEVGEHRFCTECVIEGENIDRLAVMKRMESLGASSLVVAGGRKRVRVHIHVNNPAQVFLACEEFGTIKQQKADDMERQHGLLDQSGEVAIVTDSGGDIPPDEVERLGIHVVPVRLSFGDREFMDGVTLTPQDFYKLLSESTEAPLTSQPPAQDFARVYSLLTSHGYGVISIGISGQLSGTTSAARQAASRPDSGDVVVIDSLSATAGQGLLAMAAAEAALKGWSAKKVEALVYELIPRTRVFALADDLSYAVKGGRLPAWVKRLADFLRLNPVLTASPEGKLGLSGFHLGRGANPMKLARTVTGKMDPETMYRVLVSHANNEAGAVQVRQHILELHPRVHSCHITAAGPALGVHFGPGGLIVGFTPRLGMPE